LKLAATSLWTLHLDPHDVSPVDVIGIQKKHVGKVNAAGMSDVYFGAIQNEEIQLSMPVYINESTAEGIYQVPLVLHWEDILRIHWSQTLNMGIQIKGNAIVRSAKITTTPLEFRPDTEKNKVIITRLRM
jgi:hypothetical protein